MRVIAGSFAGRKLLGPKKQRIRPTSDRVRESLFAILGDLVIGARFADLCAGTGSVGFEALSRGAWHATFVEKAHGAVALLRKNVETLGLSSNQVDVWITDVTRLTRPIEPWNIVFIDPPYHLTEKIVYRLVKRDILDNEPLVIVEHGGKEPVPIDELGLRLLDHRSYGQTSLTFLRKS
ncbi:MAG: 16S rRNA (guanine(966)-N(2))-methyltransferase RsmD [bacterium]